MLLLRSFSAKPGLKAWDFQAVFCRILAYNSLALGTQPHLEHLEAGPKSCELFVHGPPTKICPLRMKQETYV